MTYEEWKNNGYSMNKKIEYNYDENGYDDNGFDRDWVHINTATRYDEYGFNKEGNIHKDTHLPTDMNGKRRKDYQNSIFNSNQSIECFDSRIKELFFRNDELIILTKLITNFEILDINKIINYEVIELLACRPSKESIYTGPRCLDGTPDMRYNGSVTYEYKTTIKIKQGEGEKIKVLSENVNKTKVQEIINIYNFILYAIKDYCFKELYDSLININNKCKQNTAVYKKIVQDLKEKKSIYEKLKPKQNKFTDEQKSKFNNLGKDIEQISNKLKKYENYENEFLDIFEKISQRTKELLIVQKEDSLENEIDDLFAKIGD